jgi:hypothetical protein
MANIPLLGGNGGFEQALPELTGIDEEDLKNGPRDQLLVCGDCHTIEHVPAFYGPPEYNMPLRARLANHSVELADGISTHPLAITTVNAKLWAENEDFRKYITKAISAATKTGDVGLGDANYDLKSTFQEDAMACWRGEHNRTQNCEDYRSDKKRLVPPTRGERKELGMETRSKHIPSNTWLCNYCPYHSIVEDRVRKAQGFY